MPSDIAITSFDGSPDAEFTIPPLTTVDVPLAAMAADAIAEILGVHTVRTYSAQLVVCRSCGCNAAGQNPPRSADSVGGAHPDVRMFWVWNSSHPITR